MALPVTLSESDDAMVRRAVIIFGFWVAEIALSGAGSRSIAHASHEREVLIRNAARELEIQACEMEMLDRYRKASQRFSFMDHRAANWVFGEEVARILAKPGDFSISAPAAAWAIHALKAVDVAVPRISG